MFQKIAFRKLSMKYHPDRAKDQQEKEEFQQKQFELNNIMNILGDEEKRKVYDIAIHNNQDPIKALENYEQQKVTQDYDFLDPRSPNFDPSRRAEVQEKANPTVINTTLSFLDAYHGTQFTYKYNQTIICPHCKASGVKQQHKCPYCQGKGHWTEKVEYLPGIVEEITHTCEICRGKGSNVDQECNVCHGSGIIVQENQVPVLIKPGVYNGAKLIFDQQGNCNSTNLKQQNGDLVIEVFVEEQFNEWRRSGQNLLSDITISLEEALLGFTKIIYLPDGKTFKIQKQGLTQPEEDIIYQKLGFNEYEDTPVGDMIIKVHVQFKQEDTKLFRKELN